MNATTRSVNATTATLPADHLDLLDRPLSAVLTTHLADGRLQSTVVWYWRDADHLLLSTMEEFYPADSSRWIEVRGDVELVTDGAIDLLDRLTHEYLGTPADDGHVAPDGLRTGETRVVVRIRPVRVNCDAIHR